MMSKDVKFFVRPKVRFSQTDADKSGELRNSDDQKNTVLTGKPKIRSIVTLDKPVRLLKSNRSSSDENKDTKSVGKTKEIKLLTVCGDKVPSSMVQPASMKDNSVKPENQKPLSDSSNGQNVKANSEKTDTSEISKKPPNDDKVVPSASLALQDKTLDKVLKSQNNVKTNASVKSCMKDNRGKENEVSMVKKTSKSTAKTSVATKVTSNKTKPGPIPTSAKKLSSICKTSASASMRNLKSKSTIDVMPCHKYSKVVSKAKASPVKKTLIRNIVGPKIRPYVGPGVSHRKQDHIKVPETNKSVCLKPCISGEKLARPEYNSIMCTINKLNELKNQKVVLDIEHLPPPYKNLINEKISSALDFPLDEIVYKNLIDLSVDENQLPSRLTRSKDPEPRQKDIVPVLSDFFTPVSADKYCTPVSTKPRTPEITDSWNAFKISDKIFEWKHNLDYV